MKVLTIEELAEGAGAEVMEDINDLESEERESMAAKLAVQKASKTAISRKNRQVEFEEDVDYEKDAEEAGDEDAWNTRRSMGASLAARKASKDKVNCARRVCALAADLDQLDAPQELLQWGVRRSTDSDSRRTTSKTSTGSANRRMRGTSKNSVGLARSTSGGKENSPCSGAGANGGSNSPGSKRPKVAFVDEADELPVKTLVQSPPVYKVGHTQDVEIIEVLDAESGVQALSAGLSKDNICCEEGERVAA